MKLVFENYCLQVLKNDIVRLTKSNKKIFSDEATLLTCKKEESFESYKIIDKEEISLFIKGYKVTLNKSNPFNTLRVYKDDELVYKFKRIKNSGVLPEPIKTPEVFALVDSPRIILPSEGYEKNSKFKVEKDVYDLFLMLCEKDYKLLRKQYISLTGKNEMPRKKFFGYWHSRYWEYSDSDFIELINKYKTENIPLDVLVIDTDWRKSLGQFGAGYTINDDLFPNMKGFLNDVHCLNLETIFNDHPMQVDTEVKNEFQNREIKYRVSNLNKIMDLGLDAWWYDRNWYVSLKSPSKDIAPETIGNYIYNSIIENRFEKLSTGKYYRRPVTMTNIVEIKNGIYKGVLDSNSHKYTVQWSGDINCFGAVIGEEIKNMNICSNSMIAYYSSDIGGHLFDPTRDEYIRWQQYAAFSPIDRPHCCNISKPSREPWVYDLEALEIVRKYIRMRYNLSNVFYTEGYKHVNEGLGICKPLSLVWPNDKKASKITDEFMLGDNILVAPVYGNPLTKFKKSNYVDLKTTINGVPSSIFKKGIISIMANDKSPIKWDDEVVVEGKLKIDEDISLYTTVNCMTTLEIEGIEPYKVDNRCGSHPWFITKLKGNKQYKFKLSYTRKVPSDLLELFYISEKPEEKKSIYLPQGEWVDLNKGKIYQGPKTIKQLYSLDQTPVFVRCGSLIPLYKNITNLSTMSLDNVVYDFYPSKSRINEDFFYEDDGETVAYLDEINRKNPFKTYFEENRYIVEFMPSVGSYDDGLKTRKSTLKIHLPKTDNVGKILLDGKDANFVVKGKKKSSFYFNSEEASRDSKICLLKFDQDINMSYKIEVVLK